MFKFVICLFVSLISFVLIEYLGSPLYKDGLNNGKFSSLVERIRTHGTKERVTEARRVGTNPPWLKRDLEVLTDLLTTGQDFDGQPLTKAQKVIAVKALSYGGKESISATSAIIKTLNESDNDELTKISILALVRIHSITESVQDTLERNCKRDLKAEVCFLSKLFLDRLETASDFVERVTPTEAERISKELEEILEHGLTQGAEPGADFGVIREKFERASVLGRVSKECRLKLKTYIEDGSNKDLRTLSMLTLSDLNDVSEEEIQVLSSVMQYDLDFTLREEALLALRRIGTDESLALVHAYGHKFQTGDIKPQDVKTHPFLKWVKEQRKL